MDKGQKTSEKVKIPELNDLAKAGIHLGHRASKLHPKMKPYVYGVKNAVHVIDLEKTVKKLEAALEFVVQKMNEGAVILFVGTKPAAKEIIRRYAEQLKVAFVNERWLGGILTNFSTVAKLIEKLNQMTKEKEQDEWKKYSKKEGLKKEKELKRLEFLVGGIRFLNKKPDIIYIVDIQKEKTAVREAKRCKIPVVAITDTNTNPNLIDWPIPCNDDAIKAIELITGLVAEAVKIGTDKSDAIKRE
jgi:small subunit ribosomal protein S2